MVGCLEWIIPCFPARVCVPIFNGAWRYVEIRPLIVVAIRDCEEILRDRTREEMFSATHGFSRVRECSLPIPIRFVAAAARICGSGEGELYAGISAYHEEGDNDRNSKAHSDELMVYQET